MTAPHYRDDNVTVYAGDCLDVLQMLGDSSIDAVITDPPYGLDFMGKHWDTGAVAFKGEVWEQCRRILKPGGHLAAFGGTRTWHRLAVAVEDAGFEIRDSIAWLYGSGFPKSLDVSKALDKVRRRDYVAAALRLGMEIPGRNVDDWTKEDHAPGDKWWAEFRAHLPESDWQRIEREVVGQGQSGPSSIAYAREGSAEYAVTTPATDVAKQWQGWGTALKPAFEPIVVGRKPLRGTVAGNVGEYGTGALNIDACRVPGEPWTFAHSDKTSRSSGIMGRSSDARGGVDQSNPAGRWPTNVVLDGDQADELDQQSGSSVSRIGKPRGAAPGDGWGMTATGSEYADEGGASRFFPVFRYQAKADSAERPVVDGVSHPTVKPLDLMRWLVRLLTPPGGVVLDPFAGSGTTAEACIHEHKHAIAIEREADYLPLILARLSKPMEIGFDFGEAS